MKHPAPRARAEKTAQKTKTRAEAAPRSRADELAALQATLLDIIVPHDLPSLLQTIVDRATRLLDADGGGLYTCDAELQECRLEVSYKLLKDYTGTVLKYGEGAAGKVAQTGKPLVIDDYRVWPGRAPVFEKEEPFRAVLVVPMIWQGQVIGVLDILRDKRPGVFTKADQELLTMFANHAAIATANARLLQSLQQELAERKQAEIAVRESEEKFRTLAERSPNMIFINQQGRIIYANTKCAEMTGYTQEEFYSPEFDFYNLITPDSISKVKEVFKAHRKGKNVSPYEYALVTKQGKRIEVINSTELISYGGKDAILGVVTDIGQQKLAEKILRESEARFRALIEQATDMILVLQPDGIIKYASPSVGRIMGYIPEQLIGSNVFDLIHPDDKKRVMDELPQALRDPGASRKVTQARVKYMDGSWHIHEGIGTNLLADPAINGLVLNSRDITGRKVMEDSLRESQQILRTILDTIPVRVFWKDRESNYLGCNLPFAQDAGLNSPEEIRGKNDFQLGWSEQAELYRSDDCRVIESGQSKLGYEEPQTAPDGRRLWLRTSKVPLLDADGQTKGVLGTYEDITGRKLAEQALEESEVSYRGLFNSMSEAIYIQDREKRFVVVNDGAIAMYAQPREFFPGKSFADIGAPGGNNLEKINQLVVSAFKGEQQQFEFWGVRSNGEIFPQHVRLYKGSYFGQDVVISVAQDISARKHAEEALQRQLKELTILHSVVLAGMQVNTIDEMIERVTQIIGEMLYPDNFGVLLLDPGGMSLRSHASYRLGPTDKKAPAPIAVGEGVTGLVIETGEPYRVADVQSEPRYIGVTVGMRSELCVPIVVAGFPIGVINAESHEPNFFSADDERLLGTIAVQMGISIEKLRLLGAERKRRQEAETLRQAAAAISSSIELRQVLEMILISLKQVVPYDSATVILLEADRLRLVAVQGFAQSEEVLNLTFPADDQLLHESQITRKPVILKDAGQDARFNRWPGSEHVRGWMGVPLIFRDSVIGYITIDSRQPDVYNEESADLALAFTQQAAVAIENARLYEQAIKSVERRSVLHEAGQEIALASQDPQRVYETVHRATGQMMPAEAFVIALLDVNQKSISLVYLVDKGGRWPVTLTETGVGLAGRVIETGKPVIIRDLTVEPLENAIHFGEEEEVRSILAVPIRLGGNVIGMLSTQSYHPYAYTEDDQAMLEMLAAHAAIAIENSRLYVETRHRLTEMEAVSRISTALRTAQTVEDMLPILLDETLRAVETDSGALDIYDPSTGMLKPMVYRGWFSDMAIEPVPSSSGITGTVFTIGQPILSDDFATDPRTLSKVRDRIPSGWGGAAIPIRTLQETIGVMFVSLKAPRKLQPDELHLLATMSEIAGSALHRADLHQQTERQVQRLASLRAIDSAISTILDLRVTLGVLIDHIITQLKVDAVDVLLFNPNTQTLDHAASSGFRGEAITQSHQYIGEGLAGQAIRSRSLVYIPNLQQTTQDLRRQFLTGEGFVTYVGTPLIAKGQVKGVLEIYTRNFLEPDADWRSFFETLAGETAIAIENATLFEELQRTNLDLSLAYDATIEGWSRALDLRDRETEGHTLRVTEKTLQLARRIGISDTDLVHIRRGSLLHDIGKMGVPDSILHKAGTLTLAEWEIMHRHPTLAFEMLSPISYLSRAIEIPYCHHENWSGTGYPRGMKGEQIPVAARIFAVVDVWDALTSDRPYRKAWTRKDAFEYIQKNSGILFDPTVVEKFLKMLSEE